MTYNLFGGTLDLTQLQVQTNLNKTWLYSAYFIVQHLYKISCKNMHVLLTYQLQSQ